MYMLIKKKLSTQPYCPFKVPLKYMYMYMYMYSLLFNAVLYSTCTCTLYYITSQMHVHCTCVEFSLVLYCTEYSTMLDYYSSTLSVPYCMKSFFVWLIQCVWAEQHVYMQYMYMYTIQY